jgi:hypothetical protein
MELSAAAINPQWVYSICSTAPANYGRHHPLCSKYNLLPPQAQLFCRRPLTCTGREEQVKMKHNSLIIN